MSRRKHSRILLPDLDVPRRANPAFGPLVLVCSLAVFVASFRELYIIFFNSYAVSGSLTTPDSFSLQHCFSSGFIPEPTDSFTSYVARRFQCLKAEFARDPFLVWLMVSSLLACLLLRLDEHSRQALAQTPKHKQKKRKAHTTSPSKITKRRKLVNKGITQESLEQLLLSTGENEMMTASSREDSTTTVSSLSSTSTHSSNGIDCSGYPSPELGDFYEQFDENNLLDIDDPYEDPELVIVLKKVDF